MVYLGTYIFKYLNTEKITPEELFNDTYAEEVYESEHVLTATKLLHVILDAKYKKAYLNKFMETQYQHLTMTQHNGFLKLLQIFEELFDGTLGTWKIDPVDFELKEDAKPRFSRLYPVTKVHEKMFKKEVERLFLLGVLEVANDSEWGSPSVAQPKHKSN